MSINLYYSVLKGTVSHLSTFRYFFYHSFLAHIFANLRTLAKSFFVNKLSKLIRIKPLKLGMPNVIC